MKALLVIILAIMIHYPAVELTRLIIVTGFSQFSYMMPTFYLELALIWFGYFATLWLFALALKGGQHGN